jgi:hypothetical protein
MQVEILDQDRLLYSGQNLQEGPLIISVKVHWPAQLTIITSNKNDTDTQCDDTGKIINDKSVSPNVNYNAGTINDYATSKNPFILINSTKSNLDSIIKDNLIVNSNLNPQPFNLINNGYLNQYYEQYMQNQLIRLVLNLI